MLPRPVLFVALFACGGAGEPPAAVDAAPQVDAASCTKPVVFINTLATAETFTPGSDDARANQARILSAPATVAAMAGDVTAVVTAARVRLAPLGIQVTDVDPGEQAHVEIVLVGSGWPFSPGYAALSPSYCTPGPYPIAMVNAFPGRTPGDLATSIAFVLGVVTGLDYSSDAANCMALSGVPSTCSFRSDAPVQQPARCAGVGATQDQIARLAEHLVCP